MMTILDILDVSTAPSTLSIQDTQVVNKRSSAPAEYLKRKASVETPNSDSRQGTLKWSYNKNQKLELDDDLWKSAIKKLSKDAPADDDCSFFGSMVAEKLRAIPQRKRSLAQIRLLQVLIEEFVEFVLVILLL
ncbi:uncharacterized protein LOC117117442 [Anneissia japonica]|uniref:uncharacterized protein LOC117117442 n=1 Tax=Anneissia japonica TaxID=1529436 RepID=UPI0014255C65|nr:uncharacterized protein LOC117117442 [Anneissia japonica]